MKKLFISCCLIQFFVQFAISSDIADVMPITNKIVRLHFKDGAIEYKIGADSKLSETIYNFPIDTQKACYLKSYRISSIDDFDYSGGLNPIKIGRKSKGIAFSADGSKKFPYISGHFIYLVLPYELKKDAKYIIELAWIADNKNVIEFTYNETNLRSEAIHINQIGYTPDSRMKFGYVYSWMGDLGPLQLKDYTKLKFYLVDEGTQKTSFTGNIKLRKSLEYGGPDTFIDSTGQYNNFCGADVYECDFSLFKTPGIYKLVVENIGSSYPFRIENDIYRDVFYTTCRGLYHQRSGPAQTMPYTEWQKGIDHVPGVNNFKVYYSTARYIDINGEAFKELTAKATSQLMPQAWGGWFDAGDWDRDFVHLITSNYLLFVYEFSPWKFSDNELNIPESNNGLPDIIDEAKWCIDLFRRLKGPTGGVCGGIEAEGHPLEFQTSENDQLRWFTFAEDPAASFLLAASAAQLSYCLELAGIKDSSVVLIKESEEAYMWALNNMINDDIEKVKYFKMLASAWLFKCTGDKYYEDEYKKDKNIKETTFEKIAYYKHFWGDLADYAYFTTNRQNIDTVFCNSLKKKFIDKVKTELINPAQKRSCPVASFNMYREPLIGGASTPMIMPLAVAYQLTKDSVFLDYSRTTCDYFLGENPLNLCYVTGLGYNCPNEILNKNCWYDNIYQTIPGIVPFGYYHYPYEINDREPWNTRFGYKTCYPDFKSWPVHELFLENRYSVLTNEYTVWQTQGIAVSAYAFLCDSAKGFAPNKRPKVEISLKIPKQVYNENDTVVFTINSSDDKKIDKIELYNSWRKIAELSAGVTSYSQKFSPGNIFLYAKAYDNLGAYNFSDTIQLKVETSNSKPVVMITRPLNNSECTLNQSTLFQTQVKSDDSIVKVEFFDGLEKIGETVSQPYNLNFLITQKGIHFINVVATDIYGKQGFKSVKINAVDKNINSISSKSNNNKFNVYPNPFSNTLTIESTKGIEEKLYIILFTEEGKAVYQSPEFILIQNHTVSIPNFHPHGVYFYKIYNSNNKPIDSGTLIRAD